MTLVERYDRLKKVIYEACTRVSRDPSEITLVVVSKGEPESSILELFNAGVLDFGENRLVEASAKQEALPKDIHWHFIGSLQSNKVRKIVGRYTLIHSVDSLDIAEKISKVSQEENLTVDALIQVNTSGETTKHGLSIEEIKKQFHKFITLPNITFRGLMTMGPKIVDEDSRKVRKSFSDLRILRDELNEIHPEVKLYFKELSMGMSQDFEIAIEEGATIIRVGSLIFI